MRFISRFAIASLIIAMVGGLFATISVSASSLPGDSLYPIKRNLEEVRLLLEPNQTAKEQFQQQLRTTRIQEIEELHRQNLVAILDFEGVIQSILGDTWTVNDLGLKVDENTQQVGECVVGTFVRVTVQVQSDGSLLLVKAVVIPKNLFSTPVQPAHATRTPFPTPNAETRTAQPTQPWPTLNPYPVPATPTHGVFPPPNRATLTARRTQTQTQTSTPSRAAQTIQRTQTQTRTQTSAPSRATRTVPCTATLTQTPNSATLTARPTKTSTPNSETRTAQPTKTYWFPPTLPAYPPPATPVGPYPTLIATKWFPFPTKPPSTPPPYPWPVTPGGPTPTGVHATIIPPHAPTTTPWRSTSTRIVVSPPPYPAPATPVATATPGSPYPAPATLR